MKPISYKDVHPYFKLNGFYLNADDLRRIAYSFIKEGDPFEKEVGSFLLDWFDHRSWLEIPTSGSTGESKWIQVDKQAMVESALATGAYFDLMPGNRVLHCLPCKYIAGKMMLVRGFVLGLDVDLVTPGTDPLWNNDQRYDFGALVPLQAEAAFDRLTQIRKIIIGGAKVRPDLAVRLAELPVAVYETYGMTETITHIAAKPIGEPVFETLPGVSVAVDADGCLRISAPRITDVEIQTRDIVERLDEHHFIFLGRADNVVNSGGIKLFPEQIEAKLADHIPNRFFVAGIPDPKLGEKLVLYIEGPERTMEPALFEHLGKYERPKEVRFIDRFPETGSGKILRREIVVS